MRTNLRKYFILFAACFAIFIVHVIFAGHGIYGDGNGYYTYTQALYFDKGLNFGPIYSYLQHFHGVKGEFSRIFWDTGANPFPIGTGIIWIPSVALISLFVPNRFSIIYEIGPGLTGILLTIGGLYFLEKYLLNFFSKKIAISSVVFFFFASNLFYYSSFEPALSHQLAFFIISFLLWKTYKIQSNLFNYFLVGALSGLLFITRIPDSILLVPIFWQLWKTSPTFINWVVTFISALIFILPLPLSYQIMFGNPFSMPYLTGLTGTFTVSAAKIIEFLFSAKRGLFIWTPIYLVGVVGLFWSRKYMILLSLTILLLVSAFWSGRTSAGFGQRFLLSAIPYFALGLARLIEKINFRYAVLLFSMFLIWNFLTLFHFYFDTRNMIKNEDFTLNQFFTGQFQTPIRVIHDVNIYGVKIVFQKEVLD